MFKMDVDHFYGGFMMFWWYVWWCVDELDIRAFQFAEPNSFNVSELRASLSLTNSKNSSSALERKPVISKHIDTIQPNR